jgi:predicted signal transduction protein with EAL and GGDEF domain
MERGVRVWGLESRFGTRALMARADEAMYAAKHAGRDRAVAHGDLRPPDRRAAAAI